MTKILQCPLASELDFCPTLSPLGNQRNQEEKRIVRFAGAVAFVPGHTLLNYSKAGCILPHMESGQL